MLWCFEIYHGEWSQGMWGILLVFFLLTRWQSVLVPHIYFNQVIVSGKLRAQRAKSMKFKDGYMISSGHPVKEYIDSAVRHVLLRQVKFRSVEVVIYCVILVSDVILIFLCSVRECLASRSRLCLIGIPKESMVQQPLFQISSQSILPRKKRNTLGCQWQHQLKLSLQLCRGSTI